MRAPLIVAVICLGHWSTNTASAFSSPATANVKHSSASSEHTSTSLHHSLNRRSVFTIVPTAAAITTFATLFVPPEGGDDNPTNEQYRAHADEPNNLYYKSKADEEDPLAVFGRSLQQSSIIDAPSISADGKESDLKKEGVDASKSNEVTGQQLLLPPGGDLGKALMEKQQQRRIDPRTHG